MSITWKRLIGALIGVLLAALFLTIGFWRSVLIALFGFAGWWLSGDRRISKDSIRMFIHIGDDKDSFEEE